jgi:hypothetical protein
MDTQSAVAVWVGLIICAILFGGPVLLVIGMFIAWLMPLVNICGIILIGCAMIGRSMDKHG